MSPEIRIIVPPTDAQAPDQTVPLDLRLYSEPERVNMLVEHLQAARRNVGDWFTVGVISAYGVIDHRYYRKAATAARWADRVRALNPAQDFRAYVLPPYHAPDYHQSRALLPVEEWRAFDGAEWYSLTV